MFQIPKHGVMLAAVYPCAYSRPYWLTALIIHMRNKLPNQYEAIIVYKWKNI